MTPGEYTAALKGIQLQDEMNHRRAAWMVAHLINGIAGAKPPITVDDLLPKPKTESKPAHNLKEEHERLKKRFGFS